jgi:diaminopimelate decarboxylase
VRAISGGGGLPIPYHRGEAGIDASAYHACWDAARREIEAIVGHRVSLEIEPGRYIAGPAGKLVGEVRATKTMGNNFFVVVDAGFDNLVRPAMYGSWHEISVIHKAEGSARRPIRPTVVGGPLCESGDVFTQEEGGIVVPRQLPESSVGDLLIFHDAGAYASSMASNYVSRTLAPEILIDGDETRLIRRRQTIEELLALEDV